MSHHLLQRLVRMIRVALIALIVSSLSVSVVLAATQSLGGVAVTGNLRVSVYDNGSMSVERYNGAAWVNQMYGTIAKGTRLMYGGTGYHFGGESSCTLTGIQGTTVSNSTSGNTITTIWTAGSVQVTQRTSYDNGNAYYRLEWTIQNTSGATLNDLRLFHGEDTYLAGSDAGGGWWDSAYNTIGVVKIVDGNEQRMSLQGVTTPYSYASANFSSVCSAMNNGSLGGLLEANQTTDNGYALEWRQGSLAPGGVWTIIAYEKFINGAIGGLSVTAPINVNCTTGTACDVGYSVRNVGSTSVNATFSISGDQPWNPTITSGTSATIAGGSSVAVTVRVSVPPGTANGTVGRFTLTANDGSQNSSDTASVTATAPPNTAPTASNVSTAGYPNQTQTGALNVSDAEGNLSSCTITSPPAHSSAVSCAAAGNSGSFGYTPAAHYAGSDSFRYYVCDTYNACSAEAVVTISVNNRAPTAGNDAYSTNEDTPLSVPASGVLANDSDPDGQPLTASVVSLPSHGSLMLNNNGSFLYTAEPDYNGADSFVYRVFDGYAYSGNATVNLTVVAVNDTPVNTVPGPLVTDEDTALSGLVFSVADLDHLGANDLQFTLTAVHGRLTLNTLAGLTAVSGGSGTSAMTYQGTLAAINGALNGVTYTPDPDYDLYRGAETITLTSNDAGHTGLGGALTDTDTVSVTVNPVNDPPVNTLPAPFSVDEDTDRPGLIFHIADDAIDSAGTFEFTLSSSYGNLTLATTSGLTGLAGGNGTRWMQYRGTLPAINAALNSVTYRGVPNYNGPDTIVLEARDNGQTGAGAAYLDLDSVDVVVLAVNDAPVNTVPGAQTLNEDGALNNLHFGVTDVDELGAADFQFTLSAPHGTITITPTGLTLVGGSNGSASLSYQGTLAAVNAALNRVAYRPAADYNGADTLTLLSDDRGHTGAPGAQTDSDSVAITIYPLNDAPAAADSAVTTNEDTDRVLAAADFNFADVDTPYQGDTLQQLQITALPAIGAFYLDVNDNSLVDPGEDIALDQIIAAADFARFKFKPVANQNGAHYASFRFKVSDGTIFSSADYLMTIDVLAVNDAPVNTLPGAQTVDEDADLTSLSFSIADIDENGAADFRFTLAALHGTLSLTPTALTLVDGSNGSASMTYAGSLPAVNAALAAVTYHGDTDYNGADTLTLISDDNGHTGLGGAQTDGDTVTITLDPVNDVPVIEGGAAAITVTMSEDAAPTAFALTLTAEDADTAYQGDVLTWSIASAAQHGAASTSGVGTDKPIGFAPDPNFNGSDQFVVQVDDGQGGTAAIIVNVIVEPVNDAPTSAAGSVTTDEDVDYVFNAADFAFNDVDTPYQNDALQAIKITSLPTTGVLYVDTNGDSVPDGGEVVTLDQNIATADLGQLQFKPGPNLSGAPYATFRFAVSDGAAFSAGDYLMTLDVAAANDAPVNTVPGAQTVAEDGVLPGLAFSLSDVDENGASDLQFTLSASHGKLDLNTTTGLTLIDGGNHSGRMTYSGPLVALNAALSSVTYTPDANYNLHAGAEAIVLMSDDGGHTGRGGALTDTDAVSITVTAVNDPPVNSVPTAFSLDEDTDTAPLYFHIDDDAIDAATTFEFRLAASYGTPRLATLNGLTCTFATDDRWLRCTGALPDINAALAGVIYRGIADYHGPDTIVLTAWDHGNTGTGGELMDIDNVGVTVLSVNDAPINSVPAAQTVNEETDLPGLRFSFSDVDEYGASDLQVTLAAGHGSITLAEPAGLTLVDDANGAAALTYQGTLADLNAALSSVTYHGEPDFSGADAITLTTNDTGHTGAGGAQIDVDVMAITVVNVNDAPVAGADTVATAEDTPLAIDPLGNDTDPDLPYGDHLTIVSVSTPAHGLAATDGATIVYTPTLDYFGADAVEYTISDLAGLTSTAAIAIDVTPVNDAPVATGDAYTATEDTRLVVAAPGVLGNDDDVDTAALSAVKDSDPTHGTLVLNADGSFSYTPAADYNGMDAFTYHAADGALDSDVVTVSLVVTGVNDAPVAAADSASTAEDTLLILDVLSNDADVDLIYGDALGVAGLGMALHGSVTTDGAAVTYTPTLNYNGGDTFTYTVRDAGGLTSIGTVNIIVTALNDAPVNAMPGAQSINEDTALHGLVFGISDVDENGASDLQVTLSAAHGTLTLSTATGLSGSGNGTRSLTYQGTLSGLNAALNGVTYQPDADYNGADTISLTSNDNGHSGAGGALLDSDAVSVTIVPVNDPPVNSLPGDQVVDEDADLAGLVLGIADDAVPTAANFEFRLSASHGMLTLRTVSGLTLVDGGNGTHWLRYRGTLAAINAALNGVTYQGDLNYNGPDTIVLFANDNGHTGGGALTDLDSFDVTVIPVNDAPIFTSPPVTGAAQDAPYSYAITTSDVDAGDALTITAAAQPDWLTLTDYGDGTAALSGTPTAADVGNHPIELQVIDSAGAIGAQAFTLSIVNANDAPAFTSVPVTAATQDAAYTYFITAADPDADDVLTITATIHPAWLALTDHTDGTATLSGTPTNAVVGAHAVVLEVRDATGLTDTQSFTITVADINDAPMFTSVPITAAMQDGLYTYHIAAIDIDAGDALTITATAKPDWLTLTDHGDGTATLSGMPTNADVGAHAVSLQVVDRAGALATQAFTVTVQNVNDAPAFNSVPVTEGMPWVPYVYAVTAHDIDAGDALSLTALTKPAWLSFVDHGDGTGTLSGTVPLDNTGDSAVVLQARDLAGLTATQSFTITLVAPDLVVNAAFAPSAPRTDDVVTFTLTVRNAGTHAAETVVLTDTLPTGLVFDTVQGTGCAAAGNGAVCQLGLLAAGGSTVVTVTGHVTATQPVALFNMATAATPLFDTDLSNNQAVTMIIVNPFRVLMPVVLRYTGSAP